MFPKAPFYEVLKNKTVKASFSNYMFTKPHLQHFIVNFPIAHLFQPPFKLHVLMIPVEIPIQSSLSMRPDGSPKQNYQISPRLTLTLYFEVYSKFRFESFKFRF